MKTWIARPKAYGSCVVWVELGEGRMLYILHDGRHGVKDDVDLSNRIGRDDHWEELEW